MSSAACAAHSSSGWEKMLKTTTAVGAFNVADETYRAEPPRGHERIASGGAMTTAFVVPAVLEMRQAHPELRPAIVSAGPAALPELLLRGAISKILSEEAADTMAASMAEFSNSTINIRSRTPSQMWRSSQLAG